MSLDASFCPDCGRETQEKLKLEQERFRAGLREKQQAAKAIAIVFLGVLLSLIVAPPEGVVFKNAGFLLVGAFALSLLGRSAFRKSLAARPTAWYLGVGLIAAIPSFLISYLYVSVLPGGRQGAGDAAVALSLASLLALCIMPALLEEWLCRGVLWEAVRRVASARNTILITAILFAMMHGLGGGWVLEFPHRFAGGLIFGWLRLRSGSLLPGMLAHFTHNLLALVV